MSSRFFRKSSKGAVLIEFAFSVPILIIMLYFCMDVPTSYRTMHHMQKASKLAAEMIYSIKGRQCDKLITLDDLKYVSKALGITLTGRVATTSNPLPRFPFYMSTYVICVSGTSGGFRINWSACVNNDLMTGRITASTQKGSHVSYKGCSITAANLSNTDLKNFNINNGETKLIIETALWSDASFGDSRGYNALFYLLKLPGKNGVLGGKMEIISPKEDTVDTETPPPENAEDNDVSTPSKPTTPSDGGETITDGMINATKPEQGLQDSRK